MTLDRNNSIRYAARLSKNRCDIDRIMASLPDNLKRIVKGYTPAGANPHAYK